MGYNCLFIANLTFTILCVNSFTYIILYVFFCLFVYFYSNFVGVMNMGNIVPRPGIEPTSFGFRASVLTIYHLGYLMSALYPCLPVCLCGFLPERSVQSTTLISVVSLSILTIRYTHAVTSHSPTQGTFNNHTARSLYRILVMGQGQSVR